MPKLSLSNAWDETRGVLARDGRLFVAVAAALLVLPGVLSDLVTPRAPAGQMPEPGVWILVLIVGLLITIVGQLALIRLALGGKTSVGEAIGHGARRAPVFIAGQLIWALPFALVFAFLVPQIRPPQQPSPAVSLAFLIWFGLLIFVAVRMLLTAPVAGAEKVGPIAIIRRSWRLTGGQWWRLFGFLLVFIIGAVILILATASVFGLLAGVLLGGVEPFTIGALVVALTSRIIWAGLIVVLMVMLTQIYAQLSGPAEVSVPTSGT